MRTIVRILGLLILSLALGGMVINLIWGAPVMVFMFFIVLAIIGGLIMRAAGKPAPDDSDDNEGDG